MTDSQPLSHEIEISVFGPGIGESIVVHIGDGDWIVVDSCIDRKSKHPVSLDYLRSLRVDVASRVKLVVATHWHDDHIGGLAEMFRAAEGAKFVNSAAYELKDLLRLVGFGVKTPLSSATNEYDAIVRILKERRLAGESLDSVGPVAALANRKLLALNSTERSVSAEIFALSPGDGVFHLAKSELRHALSSIEQRQRPRRQGPNQLCVVLWLKVGVLNVLLGADLENVPGTTEGWQSIITAAERPPGKAICFKVPHHGSKNANCPECWTDMLMQRPIAILTSYSPSRLPSAMDVSRLCTQTPSVFLTSNPSRYRSPRRDNAVEKTLREITVNRRALTGQMGHVWLRADARNIAAEPMIILRNGATHLTV